MRLKNNSVHSESAINDNNRGAIFYKNRARQLHDFTGLRYKNITPTDIDGYFEIQNKIFVFFDLKGVDAPFPDGQRIAIERLCDNIAKPTIGIIAEHSTTPDEIVDAANCRVLKVYLDNKWTESKKPCTLKKAIDWFLENNGFGDYINQNANAEQQEIQSGY